MNREIEETISLDLPPTDRPYPPVLPVLFSFPIFSLTYVRSLIPSLVQVPLPPSPLSLTIPFFSSIRRLLTSSPLIPFHYSIRSIKCSHFVYCHSVAPPPLECSSLSLDSEGGWAQVGGARGVLLPLSNTLPLYLFSSLFTSSLITSFIVRRSHLSVVFHSLVHLLSLLIYSTHFKMLLPLLISIFLSTIADAKRLPDIYWNSTNPQSVFLLFGYVSEKKNHSAIKP